MAAVEENVKASIALARGDALTKTLEVPLMDADGKHAGQSLAKVNEIMPTLSFWVLREASSLAKTKRDVEALVEAKEKEREKKRRRETKKRKKKTKEGVKEAMMFRKKKKKKRRVGAFLSSRVVRFARCSRLYITN